MSFPRKDRDIAYQVDTLKQKTNVGAYYNTDRNTITTNYIDGNGKEYNARNQSDSILIHEQKHKDNEQSGAWAYALSPSYTYKLAMDDEISAKMAELIYLRDQYLKTGNIDVFGSHGGWGSNTQNDFFVFYKDALYNGQIDPKESVKNPDAFDREMSFIANETQKHWCKEVAPLYKDQCLKYVYLRSETDGSHAAYYDENYKRAKKILYNIGGVDFTKYISKDVKLPESLNEGCYSPQQAYQYEMYRDIGKNVMALLRLRDKYLTTSDIKVFETDSSNKENIKFYVDAINEGKIDPKKSEKDPKAFDSEMRLIANGVKKSYLQNEALQETHIEYACKHALEYMDPKWKEKPLGCDLSEMCSMDYLYNGILALPEDFGQYMVKDIQIPQKGLDRLNQMLTEKGSETLTQTLAQDAKNAKKYSNEVIREITTKEIYHKWRDWDGFRVSPVQHRTLPDMRSDIIEKPSFSVDAVKKLKEISQNK